MRVSTLRRAVGVSLFLAANTATASAQQRFEVTVPAATHPGPLTGRLVLLVSKREQPEPRLLIGPQGPAIFGVDLEQLPAGRAALVDSQSLGYPMKLGVLPAGEYFVQAVVNVYDHVTRADGHTVWLPMNDGTIEFFTTAAGNLHSDVQRVRIGADGPPVVRLTVSKVLPAPERPADTEWVKHMRIQSQKLTKFWGRPIYIHATVLLPKGYAENPDVRYPGIYAFGHSVPFGFRTDSTPITTSISRDRHLLLLRFIVQGMKPMKNWSSMRNSVCRKPGSSIATLENRKSLPTTATSTLSKPPMMMAG